MAGYLDQYGAGEERRERAVKILLLSLLGLLIVGGTLYWFFKNYRQEQQVNRFFHLLSVKDYKAAYAMWGCTDANPCRDYPISEFMKDWSARGDTEHWKITKTRSCGSGVIVTVDAAGKEEKLWVERGSGTIGFSPFPGCPPGR